MNFFKSFLLTQAHTDTVLSYTWHAIWTASWTHVIVILQQSLISVCLCRTWVLWAYRMYTFLDDILLVATLLLQQQKQKWSWNISHMKYIAYSCTTEMASIRWLFRLRFCCYYYSIPMPLCSTCESSSQGNNWKVFLRQWVRCNNHSQMIFFSL